MSKKMENNDEMMELLERHWDCVAGIGGRSKVHIVRWRLPESLGRWMRSVAFAVVAAVAVSVLLVAAVPQPGGLYASNLSHRAEAIACIDQMLMQI